MAVNNQVHAGDLGEDIGGAVGLRLVGHAQVAQGDDVVAAVGLEGVRLLLGALYQLVAHVEGQALHVVGVGLGHGLGGGYAEDAHLADGGIEGNMVAEEGLAGLSDQDVGGQNGELGGADVGVQGLQLIVKLVVAGGGGVIAGGVHERHGGRALVQADQSGALAEIAGGHQEHAGSGGLEVLLQSGDAGGAHALTLYGHVAAVGVVGVDDDQLALYICGDGVGGDGSGLSLLGHRGQGQRESHSQREQKGEELFACFHNSFHLSYFL